MTRSAPWIWGRRPVFEALRRGTVRSILVAAGRDPSPILVDIRKAAQDQGIPIRDVPAQEVERHAPGQNTQGVVAQITKERLDDISRLLSASAESGHTPFLLALDEIQDPHNFGALLRTANCAGVQGVIVPHRRSAQVSGTVAKTSAGAVSHVPILEVPNLARALKELSQAGLWIAGLDGAARSDVFSADLTAPLVLVIGSEGSGLRRLVRERCDFLLRLPMLGSVGSLNASVAGGIAMYEVVRQRLTRDPGPQ